MELFIMQTLSGLSWGIALFIVASGLVIIFSILNIVNIAHGAFFMFGVYLCFWVTKVILPGWPMTASFAVALIAAPLLAAMLGGVIEVSAVRPTYKLPPVYQLIVTFGLAYIIADLCRLLWGMDFYTVAVPEVLRGSVGIIGRSTFPVYNLFVIGFGVALFLALHALFHKTKLGMILRATTTDREMMSALGWDTGKISTLAFMLGIFLAALGGTIMAPMIAVGPGIDATILVNCFVIVVAGGFGSLGGALLGAVLLGLINGYGVILLPRLAIAFPFMFMAIVLIVRPWGLLGKPIRQV